MAVRVAPAVPAALEARVDPVAALDLQWRASVEAEAQPATPEALRVRVVALEPRRLEQGVHPGPLAAPARRRALEVGEPA
jgi:hypothetical protein